jgi:hypothetical protein
LLSGGLAGVFQFGFELGTGVRTYLPTAAPHVLALLLLLGTVSLPESLAAGVGFGVGRGALQLLTAMSSDRPRFRLGWRIPVDTLRHIAGALAVLFVLATTVRGVW